MKIVAISDTHGRHDGLVLPPGDLLIHAGDLTDTGTLIECQRALQAISELAKGYRLGAIIIAGNHDWLAERQPDLFQSLIPEGVIYLNDSGVTLDGVHFWGTPVQPTFYNWAFNRDSQQLRRHWQMIPKKTDVLIVHGPPHGILDKTVRGQHVGSPELSQQIEVVRPKLVICGHIHEGYGIEEKDGITYMNASLLDVKYRRVNKPFEYEFTGES